MLEAVEEMVRTAGRVVLVSGVVLLFTWLALAAFPVFGTDTLGYCSAITMFTCIVVNVSMNPALMLAFPTFFAKAAQDPWRCCRYRRRDAPSTSLPLTTPAGADARHSCYGRLAARVVRMPGMLLVPLVVYALLTPGAVRLFTANIQLGANAGSTPATQYATEQILRDFPCSIGGVPLSIMLNAPVGELVTDKVFFSNAGQLMQRMQRAIRVFLTDFHGPVVVDGASSIGLRPSLCCRAMRSTVTIGPHQ